MGGVVGAASVVVRQMDLFASLEVILLVLPLLLDTIAGPLLRRLWRIQWLWDDLLLTWALLHQSSNGRREACSLSWPPAARA